MAKILIKFNQAIIKEVVLEKDVTTFGRKENNDVVINHPSVSGFHGKIIKQNDKFTVEDLNSTNGTFLNGRRIKSSSLQNKDNIRVAKHILEFYTDDKADPSKVDVEPTTTPEAASVQEQKEMLKKSLGISADAQPKAPENMGMAGAPPKPDQKPAGDVGTVKIVAGSVAGQSEVKLNNMVTYIGASDQALIKIKGFLAPSLAAAISRRPEGYFLKAVKSGYPKVNGNPVKEQILLENGALLEIGGTNMVFYFNDGKKNEQSKQPPANA